MKRNLILAIDQGTTGTTALLVDDNFQIRAKSTIEFPQVFPQPGYVEHRPFDLWASVKNAVAKCLEASGANAHEICAIGIANQRETVGVFRRDGEVFGNFIVWQCRRTAEACAELERRGLGPIIQRKTGLVLDPYFSATKIQYILEHNKSAMTMTSNGDAIIGTIDSWLLFMLSGKKEHKTDVTNASRTMLMNLESTQFDPELCDLFSVPLKALPEICSNSEIFGRTQGLDFLPDGIPICGMAGDQQAALFGQQCIDEGQAKATLGTGCFILINTGDKIVLSRHGLLSSVASKIDGRVRYCIEGSAFSAGSAVQWLRDGLGIISNAKDIEDLAGQVPDTQGVVFVPAFNGLGAPHWLPNVRAQLSGVSRGTNRAHIARAVLEGIVMQNCDIFDAVSADGIQLALLRLDGGASANDLLAQMHADFLGVECQRLDNLESTAFGAALFAALGVGWKLDVSKLKHQKSSFFSPGGTSELIKEARKRWQKAIEALKS